MRKNIILVFLAVFLLFTAVLVYFCFRPHNILFFKWLDFVRFDHTIFQIVGIKLPNFIIYNFTNALFLIFGYIFLYIIWGNNKNHYLFYMIFITSLNILYEIITQDINDIITIFITFTISILVYNKCLGAKYEK
jgi:hypothetical protein